MEKLVLAASGPGYPAGMVTRDQIQAGGALLNWSQNELAVAASLSPGAIKNIERGALDPRASMLAAIEEAFDLGVMFLDVGDMRDGGRGVRMKRGSD